MVNLREVKKKLPDMLSKCTANTLPSYIIIFNPKYSEVPLVTELFDGHYALHSLITFEEVRLKQEWEKTGDSKRDNEPVNHFMTIAFDEHGYFIYDDLLSLSPGGYQGS